MTAALDIVDLGVRYGAVEAVAGLTMSAAAGAVTAVLGPNGAGKTTTIETAEGYRRRFTGQVRVLGRDPVADHAELRQRVGVMLQAGGVPGAATADQVLTYTAGLYAHPLDLGPLAERLGIDRLGRTPFRRLSGGEQQRVKLALAVVGRPELVFLDEPTAGLDPQARLATWELIRALRTDGVTVILTSHLMLEATELADHVVIVDHGRCVAAGSPAELVAAHSLVGGSGGTARSIRFSAPPGLDLAALLAALPAGAAASESPAGSYLVDGPQGGPALLAALTGWCADHGVDIAGLSVGVPAGYELEQLLLDLTGRAPS